MLKGTRPLIKIMLNIDDIYDCLNINHMIKGERRMSSTLNTLRIVVVLFAISAIVIVPVLYAKEDMAYDKKLYKHLKKRDIKELPQNNEYPDAAAIIICDEILKEQFFGYYSIWDITYKENRYKVWKVIKPEEARLQKVEIDLGNNKEVEEFKLTIYPLQGEDQKIKKEEMKLHTYTYPEGGSEYKKAVLELPELSPNTILEMEYVLNVSETLFWDEVVIQGQDPIVYYSYGFLPPEFIRLSPTQLYGPVAHKNQFLYRFRAYDPIKKKLLTPEKKKNGFYFNFHNLPAIDLSPHLLPLRNRSAFVAFTVDDIIIKDPVARYEEDDQNYMQISPDTDANFIRSAGSPDAYKISISDWSAIADFLYFDLFNGIADSQVFADQAKALVGDVSSDTMKIQKIYSFLANEFTLSEFRPPIYALPIKDLEILLEKKTSSRGDLGFIFWGLLHHAGIASKVGLGFTHNEFVGEFDRKFPLPIHFSTSLILIGEGEKAKAYYPGDPFVKMGSYPPEIDGSDFLIVSMKSQEEIAKGQLYETDKLNPYIKLRKMYRLNASWQMLQVSSPLANKISTKFEINVAEDGTITAKAMTIFYGHTETDLRRQLSGLDQTEVEKVATDWYAKQLTSGEIVKATVKNFDKLTGTLEFDAEIKPAFTIKDNQLTIPFSFFNQTHTLPISEEYKNNEMILLPYRSFVWNDFMVRFDKKWTINKAPESKKFQAEEGMAATNIRQTELDFNYQRGFTLTKIFVKGDEVGNMFGYFDKIKELETTDVLVLQKQ